MIPSTLFWPTRVGQSTTNSSRLKSRKAQTENGALPSMTLPSNFRVPIDSYPTMKVEDLRQTNLMGWKNITLQPQKLKRSIMITYGYSRDFQSRLVLIPKNCWSAIEVLQVRIAIPFQMVSFPS